ncbi:hypothetical protein AGABI1DRAFT_124207 [Agaricus bisporus var. burnettii JB137-S8]|uniref:TECPR1-like DysF domain-containing protein n=1 Tax=Agaricus bisporus var. burnettii (strain JB137-S8 / ATCC MYA-4627 / FGSC 10392) TaxID=597362 RepID=K5XKH9_AGABU|nr:uncharacterized protein AGABI1DRAFT_124207 [Agaricus bisporus var. burnettii JB137-S8]EKM83882.1 hypothetical protein AGABI1DRAFT_124207 [Agaricus bisporus var. burnettii JB137-S8]
MGKASTASSKSLSGHSDEEIAPPPAVDQSVPQDVAAARRKLASPSRLFRIFSFSALRRYPKSSDNPAFEESGSQDARKADGVQDFSAVASSPDDASIILESSISGIEDEDDRDRFEWAVVYENQRGMTLFSIPYYSALSLLPADPLAFTLPNASRKRSKQPEITLSTYPLPDGDWRWVSRAWMIDMRSDRGVVQHDGFEYNWTFRRHKWRPEVGFLSAGGWVRRRRWVRLMMRPRKARLHSDSEGSTSSTSSPNNLSRYSVTSSNLISLSDVPYAHIALESVWRGDESDWRRCRSLMLRYGQDGRKIDLWKKWLGFCRSADHDHFCRSGELGKRKGKEKGEQWTEDNGTLTSEFLEPHPSMTPPPREHLIPVLRQHGYDLLQLFVYPESRVQFLKLLGTADLLPEFGIDSSLNFKTGEVDFWSYTRELESSTL